MTSTINPEWVASLERELKVVKGLVEILQDWNKKHRTILISMGWTPVNNMTLARDFENRQVVVKWVDEITGEQERRFSFEDQEEALEFAVKEFSGLAM